jgi:transketolase
MGSAITEMLSQNFPVPIKIIGIPDVFGESAREYQQLLDKYGLTVENIVKNYNNF